MKEVRNAIDKKRLVDGEGKERKRNDSNTLKAF